MAALLEVKDLCVDYVTLDGHVRAVDNVSFSIGEGQIFGLAGESGCGKSTLAYALMRLHRPPALITSGSIVFDGQDILAMDDETLRKFRWEQISMVFQSAMNCLNPVRKLEKQFYEIFKYHDITDNLDEARDRTAELLKLVGIAPERMKDYPHQFSGGMRQRAVIAMALALRPKLLIMDEPTTALDTVVQRSILQKVQELKDEFGFSILFITHDLSLMMEFCDTIGIMYAAEIIEQAPSSVILNSPRHPYSFGLKNSFPPLHGEVKYMEGIPGSPLDLRNIPEGCRFAERCFNAKEKCFKELPPRSHDGDDFFECHFPLEVSRG